MPKVSVITPCYNSGPFVGATLTSLRSQSFQDWEHIIVDDGSTDNSAAIVETVALADARIKLVRKLNGGVAQARNLGYIHSTAASDYLLFLDADDVIDPDMLDLMVQYLDRHLEVGMLFCRYYFIDSEGVAIAVDHSHLGWEQRLVPTACGVRRLSPDAIETPFASILAGAGISPSISLIRRTAYQKTPGWDERFGHVHEDADLFLYIALRSQIHHFPKKLVGYRQHAAQATKDRRREATQYQKLLNKWRTIEGLSIEEGRTVKAAIKFVENRVVPYRGLAAAKQHARDLEPLQAARFGLGAARRYIKGLLAS